MSLNELKCMLQPNHNQESFQTYQTTNCERSTLLHYLPIPHAAEKIHDEKSSNAQIIANQYWVILIHILHTFASKPKPNLYTESKCQFFFCGLYINLAIRTLRKQHISLMDIRSLVGIKIIKQELKHALRHSFYGIIIWVEIPLAVLAVFPLPFMISLEVVPVRTILKMIP